MAWVAVGITFAVPAGAYTATTWSGGGDERGAVVRGIGPHGWATRLEVGSRFTNGMPIMRNTGDSEVTILQVKPDLDGDGLTFLGAHVAGLDRQVGQVQDLRGYPPADVRLGDVMPVEGLVLTAGEESAERGYELLLGFEVTGNGRTAVRGIDVTYDAGEGVETVRLLSTLAVCVPKMGPECPQEYPAGHGG